MTTDDALLISEGLLAEYLGRIHLELPPFYEPLEGALEVITGTIISWTSWVGEEVLRALTQVGGAFWDFLQYLFSPIVNAAVGVGSWIADHVASAASWLWDNITDWFTGIPDRIRQIGDDLGGFILSIIPGVTDSLVGWVSQLWGGFQAVIDFVEDHFGVVGEWIGQKVDDGVALIRKEIADPITDFFMDLPERIGAFFSPLYMFFQFIRRQFEWFAMPWEFGKIAEGYKDLWKYITTELRDTVESFWDSILGWIQGFAPMSPAKSPDMARGLLTLAGLSVGGLALMTLGGEMMHPLKQMGLGHISAMVGDVVNYRMISGVVMGAILTSGLRTPLNYYINTLLRPWLLSPRDFMELLARDAFTNPEGLRTPELIQSIKQLAPEGGSGLIDNYIGWMGYPAEFRGFFTELSYTRLGYFPLAGIARTGFFDEAWFLEAVQRTGYSATARDALMVMYREMVYTARITPSMFHIRRLVRDGYMSVEEAAAKAEEISKIPTLTAARVYSFDLEREYEEKVGLLDIISRAYTRGIIDESEAAQGLAGLGLPGYRVDQELLRSKLGLVRRLAIDVPQVTQVIEIIEEG